MTDRLKGVFVAFEREIREDDAQPIIDAIKMMRGVAGVKRSTATPEDYAAERRVEVRLRDNFWKFYQENFK